MGILFILSTALSPEPRIAPTTQQVLRYLVNDKMHLPILTSFQFPSLYFGVCNLYKTPVLGSIPPLCKTLQQLFIVIRKKVYKT